MTEAVKVLGPEEALEQIHSHIPAYLKGGPNLEADDIVLAQQLGLNVESITRKWADAKEYLLFICQPVQPEVVTEPEALVEQRPSASVKAVKEEIGPSASKRRPVPPDPSEEKAAK